MILRNKMTAFFKKFLSQLFVSVILKENKNTLKALIYRNEKLVSKIEKSFEKEEKLFEFLKALSKKYRIYYNALILNVEEQGFLPLNSSQEDLKELVGNMSVKTLTLNDFQIYTATEHVDYFDELFEEWTSLDFVYSPFALLYYLIQKEKFENNKVNLCVFKHDNLLAMLICKNKEILGGDFKLLRQENDSISQDYEELKEQEDEFDQEQNDLADEQISQNIEENIEENSTGQDTEENSEEIGQDAEENSEQDKVQIEELNRFSNDMEFCRCIISGIEKIYNNPKYSGGFIEEMVIFNNDEILVSALDFLEAEVFMQIRLKRIDTLDLSLELMQKELYDL